MQAGFTKNCCFLCLWDCRAVSQHYNQKDWGSRSTFVPDEHSLKENPLVDMNKVLLPPLHIKLGLMKNFVKALHKNGAAFQHLSTVFPGLSAAKLKEGIFVGPQISPFTPQLLPAKPWSSEWWAWRKIPLRRYEDGEQLSRQMEPRHDGRLLLDALAWHPGGKIHQIF